MRKLIYLFIIITVCSGSVVAQATDSIADLSADSSSDSKTQILNGHRFPSTSYMRSAFVSTSVQADLGFGATSALTLPGISVGENEILGFTGKLIYIDLDVQYQQRFTPWLALFISAKMAGRVGSDMSTMLVDGVNTLMGGDIGWLVRIKETEKFMLSAAIKLTNIRGNFINIPEYFEELINNEPYPSVIKQVPGLTAGLGLRSAYAFNPTYGLQFSMDYMYGETLTRETSQSYIAGSILGDIDFYPKQEVPVGLALGYALSTSPALVMFDGGSANLVLFKIDYTGSDDFELGLQFNMYSTYLKSIDDKAFVKKVMLGFKFYF
jgi:hypothetical protein